MKKALASLAILICLMFSVNPVAAQQTVNPNGPEITFDSEVVDYGTIDQNSNGVREFKFRNTGKEPLIITNVVGQCGCTTLPDGFPKEPIKPGANGSIKVKYDTNRVGAFDKKVTVSSNAKTAQKQVTIKGIVKASSSPSPAGK